MKLSIDLDNTILNTTECVLSFINKRIPVDLKISDITTYSIEDALPPRFKWIVEDSFTNKNMWKNIELLPDSAEIIEKIYNDGHEIWFATSSLPENLRKKINHLTRNLPFFPEGYVQSHTINIQDKYLLNVDVLIDDAPVHLWHKDRKYYSIAMSYPWNESETADKMPMFTRAKNWTEVYNRIKMIESLVKEND